MIVIIKYTKGTKARKYMNATKLVFVSALS